MTNGTWTVQGTQISLPSGGSQSLGPFNIAFANVLDTQSIVVNTTATVPVPTAAQGVWVIPPSANTHTLTLTTTGLSASAYVSGQIPSFIAFDTVNAHVPANIYLEASSSTTVVVQFV